MGVKSDYRLPNLRRMIIAGITEVAITGDSNMRRWCNGQTFGGSLDADECSAVYLVLSLSACAAATRPHTAHQPASSWPFHRRSAPKNTAKARSGGIALPVVSEYPQLPSPERSTVLRLETMMCSSRFKLFNYLPPCWARTPPSRARSSGIASTHSSKHLFLRSTNVP